MWRTIYLQDGGDGVLSFDVLFAGSCHISLPLCFLYYFLCLFQITDLTLARENQQNFETYLSISPNVDPGIDLNVNVLTTGFWPTYRSFDLNLPEEMVRAQLLS